MAGFLHPSLTHTHFLYILFFKYTSSDHVNTASRHGQGGCPLAHLPPLCFSLSPLCPSVSPSLSSSIPPSWPLGLPTVGPLTLSWSHLANAPILLGQAGLSRAGRELDQIWEGGHSCDRLGAGRGGEETDRRHRPPQTAYLKRGGLRRLTH